MHKRLVNCKRAIAGLAAVALVAADLLVGPAAQAGPVTPPFTPPFTPPGGGPAGVSARPSTLNFGSVNVGSSATLLVTLSNAGPGPKTISSSR